MAKTATPEVTLQHVFLTSGQHFLTDGVHRGQPASYQMVATFKNFGATTEFYEGDLPRLFKFEQLPDVVPEVLDLPKSFQDSAEHPMEEVAQALADLDARTLAQYELQSADWREPEPQEEVDFEHDLRHPDL